MERMQLQRGTLISLSLFLLISLLEMGLIRHRLHLRGPWEIIVASLWERVEFEDHLPSQKKKTEKSVLDNGN